MSHFQSQWASFKDTKDADVFPKKMYLALERHQLSLVIHVFGVFGVFERHQRHQRLTLRFADVVLAHQYVAVTPSTKMEDVRRMLQRRKLLPSVPSLDTLPTYHFTTMGTVSRRVGWHDTVAALGLRSLSHIQLRVLMRCGSCTSSASFNCLYASSSFAIQPNLALCLKPDHHLRGLNEHAAERG